MLLELNHLSQDLRRNNVRHKKIVIPMSSRVHQKWMCSRKNKTICSFIVQAAKKVIGLKYNKGDSTAEKSLAGGKMKRTKYMSKYLESFWALHHKR